MVTNCSDKLLMFDCDGTLVDSEMLCNSAMETCLERVGIVESASSLLARYRGAKLSGILADIGDRHARVLPAGFVERYRDEVSRLFARHLKPTDGVAQALVQLSNPRCVASSGPVAKICQALEVTGLARRPRQDEWAVVSLRERVVEGIDPPTAFASVVDFLNQARTQTNAYAFESCFWGAAALAELSDTTMPARLPGCRAYVRRLPLATVGPQHRRAFLSLVAVSGSAAAA